MIKKKRIKLSPNFYLDEYIDKDTYLKYENKPYLLRGLIDNRIILIDQFLRNRFGQITINNWVIGGVREWSGVRTFKSPQYTPLSQHTYGRASDKIFKEVTAEEVRNDIIKNYYSDYLRLGLTCIEKNTTWLHSDCRFLKDEKLLIVI